MNIGHDTDTKKIETQEKKVWVSVVNQAGADLDLKYYCGH